MQTTTNRLVIEIESQFSDKMDIGDGKFLYIDTKFNPEEKVSLIATVKAVPRRIVNHPGQSLSMGGLTVGDRIMIRYDVLAETRDQPDRDTVRYVNQFFIDGKSFWLCDIEQVFARWINPVWQMLNDYVMISPTMERTEQIGLIIVPEHYQNRRIPGLGRVISGADAGEIVRFHPAFGQEYRHERDSIIIIRDRYIMGVESAA